MIQLRIPATLQYRDLAVRVVAAACKLVGDVPGSPPRAGREFDDQVISAFGEAFNNAAIHCYRDLPLGDVQIELEVGRDQILIRIMDHGRGFPFDEVPAPDLDALPESGLGIYIIKSFMDEVTYRPGTPNVLSMRKHLPSVSP